MLKKIITALAIILNLAQISFVIYFLAMYTTDNMPLFEFLFFVPAVSVLAILLKRKI